MQLHANGFPSFWRLFLRLAFFCVTAGSTFGGIAVGSNGATPALAFSASCAPPEHASLWNERWVWRRLCMSGVADLTQLAPSERILSPAFIEVTLTRELGSSLNLPGTLRVVGAVFSQQVSLDDARLGCNLEFDETQFRKGISLEGLSTSGSIVFKRVTIGGTLNMHNATIGNSLIVAGLESRGDREQLRMINDVEMADISVARDSTFDGLKTPNIDRKRVV